MLSLSSSLLRPHPPVWITLSDFPFGYTESLGHSRAILTATQTFPTLTARHCMIAICSTPEDPIGACPIFFPIGNSHRLLTTGLPSSSFNNDASTTCSLSLRPSCLLATLLVTCTSELSSGQVTLPQCRISLQIQNGN